MKYRQFIFFIVFASSTIVAQNKKDLIQKCWYVNCDTEIDPEKVKFITFYSEKPARDPRDKIYDTIIDAKGGVFVYPSLEQPKMCYGMWAFDTDGKLAWGSGGTLARSHWKWKIRRNVLRIASLKFRIAELSESKLVLERK